MQVMINQEFSLKPSLMISSPTLHLNMLASAVATVALGFFLLFYPNAPSKAATSVTEEGLGVFSDIYEPSGAVQLTDGRVLIVEDEIHRAMNLLTIAPNGSLVEDKGANIEITKSFDNDLSDLEGAATDDRGFVYAITSHSTLKKNKREPNREQLVRFRVQGNKAVDIHSVKTLRDDLEQSERIASEIQAHSGNPPNFDNLDIEGLAYDNKTKRLMLGLRAPMSNDMSLIIAITNPDEMFDKGEIPVFDKPIFLNLDGGGIRSLHFNNDLNQYIIANEVANKKGKNRSKIWTWSGNAKEDPILMNLPELKDLDNIEGIASVTINGRKKLLFTPDEGVEKKEKPAKYRYVNQSSFR